MYKILLADDDESILEVNSKYLQRVGFTVYAAANAIEAVLLAKRYYPDLTVLDISMPDKDGYEICSEIKDICGSPVIFLTNYSQEDMLIKGFLAGGDDYMTKPYSLRELEMRIYARLKEASRQMDGSAIVYDSLSIDPKSRLIHYGGSQLDLTPIEFDILLFLARNPNKIFNYSEIYMAVWNMPSLSDAHTLQVHVAKLRQKLDKLCPGHKYIKTVKGKGYRFNAS